ncbi:putative LIM-domain binding protein/SEUSS [Helianthus debilis subsp. tardiflorus]
MWSAQAALALPNYQNIIMRQNSVNSNAQQEASSSFNNSNQNEYPFQGMAVGGFQQRPMLQAPQSHQQAPHSGGHAIQHMIQQLLQDMSNGVGGQKPSVSRQSATSGSMSMVKV